jgi:hypothetical protein
MTQHLRSRISWVLSLFIGIALAIAIILWEKAGAAGLQGKDLYSIGVELYRALFIGAAVALAGTLLPLIFKEARDSFEQRKAARHAYSRAKTGLDYAHVRLASLDWAKAVSLLESIHVNKHLAESYPELSEFIRGSTVKNWGNNAFEALDSYRKVMEDAAEEWNNLLPSERLRRLREAYPGYRGSH